MSLQSNTFANSLTPLFAPAGESAKNWYLFPALNGTVLLADVSGIQTLQAIGNDLFYNGELIAKASDIQDIAAWSDYPAINNVNMDGFSLVDVSGLTVNNGATMGTLLVSNGITSEANITSPSLQIAGAAIPSLGQITTATLAASGLIQAGSVTSTGAISGTAVSGTSLATTGGLDMTNTAVTRASSVGLSNAGAAPYGALTSPDGVLLTWNGQSITTGAAGNVSQWANYPAVTTINANSSDITNAGTINSGNVIIGGGSTGLLQTSRITTLSGAGAPALSVTAYPGLSVTADAGNITTTAGAVSGTGNISTTAKGVITDTAYGEVHTITNNFEVTCDGGLNPITTPNINLVAKNGNGGQINVTADPGSILALGGVVNITGNGGTVTIPQPPPELPISVTVGGEVNITANTGSGAGLYTATSAINLNAAAINSYAGAIPSIGSLLGYNTVFGNLGVSICAGLPPSGIQFPGTIYCYGLGIPGVAGGVRIESPQGIQMLSDTYIENLYPLDGNDLNIQGRSLPTGYVNIKDVAVFEMTGFGHLKTDFINSKSGNGLFYEDTLKPLPGVPNPGIEAFTLKPPLATSASSPNLVISNNPFTFLGYNNFVEIANATTIAFDVSGSGALSGVQSINGASWPPPTGDASLWSQYPATSIIDVSGYGLIKVGDLSGVTTINGSVYPPVVSSADWSQYPALQNVDISGFDLDNVNNLTMPDNGVIVSAGQLSIFADNGKNLNIATNGGGDVNIGTGNTGSIFIQTVGTGNDLSLAGDTTTITAAVKLTVDTPIIDVVGADIQNVSNITNEATNLLTVQSTANLIVSAETALTLVSDSADVTVQSQTGVAVYAATGNVTLTADSGEVIVQDSVLNMNTHKITNLTAGTAAADAVNYTQLTFRDNTEFYVSNQGSDISGNGSILAPFQTIQTAITAAELISSAASICNINVASGNYPQSLTFNKGYIVLNGTLQSQTGNEVCEITGSITINCTGANDVFNRQVAFQGFNITCGAGQSITNTSTSSHTVSFQDCKIFVNSVCYNSTASCADARTYFTNVEVYSTNAANVSPVITTNVGLVELERMDLTVDGNAIGVLIGGTSVLNRFSLSTLDNTNTAATLLPLLSFTSTTTSAHSLGNVAFAFTSAVSKTATNAIYINSGINTTIIALNCVFTLQGTSSSTNFTVGYNGVGSPAILGVNNTSLNIPVLLPQTTAVQPGIGQISYTDINPPVMACYSTTGDQTIGVANTPQVVTFNTTQFQQGTSLVATTRFYVSSSGNYQVCWALNLSGVGSGLTTSFLKKNGTTVANTGSQTSVFAGSTSVTQVSPNFTLPLNAGDYLELWWNSNALAVSINSTGAINGNAATPGAVFNITQIR